MKRPDKVQKALDELYKFHKSGSGSDFMKTILAYIISLETQGETRDECTFQESDR